MPGILNTGVVPEERTLACHPGIKSYNGEKPEEFSEWYKKTNLIPSMQRPDIFGVMEDLAHHGKYVPALDTRMGRFFLCQSLNSSDFSPLLYVSNFHHGQIYPGVAY